VRRNIEEYQLSELVALVEWIESDGHLRTDQDLGQEMVKELGFKRHGARIDEAIKNAIAQRRWRAKSTQSKAAR
jgi:hypothetical protein